LIKITMSLSESSRLLLELLNGLDEPVRGRTMMQKIVFILRSRFYAFKDFTYSLHYYGPFSRDLANQLDFLVARGLVEEDEVPTGGALRYDIYITEDGRRKIGTESSRQVNDMVSMARGLNEMPLPQVIDQAYEIASTKGL
jgi:uncharacterized protein